MLLVAALALALGAAQDQFPQVREITADGWSYGVSQRGTIESRGKAADLFADLSARLAEGAARRANAPVWEVLVVIPKRADIVDRTGPFVQLRRGALRTAVDDVKLEVASFARAAEALSGGHLRVRIHTRVEESAVRTEQVPGGPPPFGVQFVEGALTPLMNATVFDPADPAYRGPFDSAFYLHPGLVTEVAKGVAQGTSFSGMPLGNYLGPQELALAMVNEWTSHLRVRALSLGFPVPGDVLGTMPAANGRRTTWPEGFMTEAIWRAIGGRHASSDEYVSRRGAPRPGRYTWPEVAAHPYRLPLLDLAAMSELGGQPFRGTVSQRSVSFGIDSVEEAFTGGIDRSFEPTREAAAVWRAGEKAFVFVEWRFADLYGSHFAEAAQAVPIGRLSAGGFQFVVFAIDPAVADQPEINLLTLEGIPFEAHPLARGEARPPMEGVTALDGRSDPLKPPGPMLVEVTRDGRKRLAAVSVMDPLELTVPEWVELMGEQAVLPIRATGNPATSLTIRFETPPGWTVPPARPLAGGTSHQYVLSAPPGPLSQEVRVHFEGADGWKRTVPIKVSRLSTPVALDLAWGSGAVPSSTGAVVGGSAADPERGTVARFEESGQVRRWTIDLLKRAGGRPAFYAGTHRYVELTLDGSLAEPLDLVFEEVGGARKVVRLFELPGSGPAPAPWTVGVGKGWETVVVDLQQVGVTGMVERVTLEPPLDAVFFERPRFASEFRLARLRVLSEAAATPLVKGAPVVADAQSESKWARARAAAEGSAMALLGEFNDLVAVNVAAALRKQQDPASVPGLALHVRNLESAVVREAVFAVAHQDQPAGWDALKGALDAGPSDEARAAAAEILAARGDLAVAATLTSLIVATEPSARIAGVRALASMPGAEPAQMLLVFLQDVEPAVRLEVVRLANVDTDTVARRVQYESVNDPSDAVRAASYLALIKSRLPGFADEGYRGVRDESRAVRLTLLEAFRSNPVEAHRRALQFAAADTDPRVRGAALLAFATQPGTVTLEEVGGVIEERDPRVQGPLIELADKKKLVLPESSLRVLRESVDPHVAAWARGKGAR